MARTAIAPPVLMMRLPGAVSAAAALTPGRVNVCARKQLPRASPLITHARFVVKQNPRAAHEIPKQYKAKSER